MDSRVKTLIGAAALFAVIIVVVVIAQGGGDDEADGPATAERQDKPTVEIPEGDPPKELVTEDLEEGDGSEAQSGDQLTVDYVGVLYDGGDEFDASFGDPEPFQFVLGQGAVIPGWDEGLEGMKVGGRRQLVIPPDLAYGPQGQPPDIPPDSTLVFVIDLLAVN
jgi:peptidylprolyl isomerase